MKLIFNSHEALDSRAKLVDVRGKKSLYGII